MLWLSRKEKGPGTTDLGPSYWTSCSKVASLSFDALRWYRPQATW